MNTSASESSPVTLLATLIALNKTDTALALLERERKKLDLDLSRAKTAVVKGREEVTQKSRVAQDRQERYRREEKSIRDENDKLTNRRKALATLGNYKLQQAAEREIEANAKQLQIREEALLKVLDEADALQKEATALQTRQDTLESDYEGLVRESAELFAGLEDRVARHQEVRAKLLPSLTPADLTVYERTKVRFPENPVVPVNNNNCSGCFMQVGPQIAVQLARANALVKCPGCSRLLFLEEKKEESGA